MARLLGGTNGIPSYDERTYVCDSSVTEADGHVRPTEIAWSDGRRFPIVASTLTRVLGRWEFGTVVKVWDIELKLRARRQLFWERGRWFVPRRSLDRNGERAPGEPVG